MNQISLRFSSLCRSSSLLRKNQFIRWSPSKPISSTSSSSNLIKVFISKHHYHTFNYPQIPGNHFRKFSGEAAECNFRDGDYLKNEISKVRSERNKATSSIEFGDEPPLDAVEILAEKYNALMEKLGLPTLNDNEKEAGDDDYPPHLRFREEIQDLVESVDKAVAFAEFVEAGGDIYCRWDRFMSNYRCMLKYHEIIASLRKMKIRSRLMRRLIGYPSPPKSPGNHHFRKFSEGAEGFNFGSDDHLQNEIWEVEDAAMCLQSDVQLDEPPFSAVKVVVDKFNDLMEKLGLEMLEDDEKDEDFPPHLWRFREKIQSLVESVDMNVAFAEYATAGGTPCWQPFMGNYRCMIKYEEILASLQKMKVRSKLMRRLIKAESDFQSTVVVKGPCFSVGNKEANEMADNGC